MKEIFAEIFEIFAHLYPLAQTQVEVAAVTNRALSHDLRTVQLTLVAEAERVICLQLHQVVMGCGLLCAFNL
jgi:hypothetical protein